MCEFVEDVNRGSINMSNGKTMDVKRALEWTRPQTRQWITTIMDEPIGKVVEYWPINWIDLII